MPAEQGEEGDGKQHQDERYEGPVAELTTDDEAGALFCTLSPVRSLIAMRRELEHPSQVAPPDRAA